jgi:hypothetical protein
VSPGNAGTDSSGTGMAGGGRGGAAGALGTRLARSPIATLLPVTTAGAWTTTAGVGAGGGATLPREGSGGAGTEGGGGADGSVGATSARLTPGARRRVRGHAIGLVGAHTCARRRVFVVGAELTRWRRCGRRGRDSHGSRHGRRFARRERGLLRARGLRLLLQLRSTGVSLGIGCAGLLQRDATDGLRRRHRAAIRAQREALERGALRHDQIGIDARLGLLAEVLLHHLPHERHAGRAADEDDAVELRRRDSRDTHRVVAHRERTLDERTRELLERRARETEREIERRAGLAVCELFHAQVDLGLERELALRPLGGRAEALVGLRVVAWIEAVMREEGACHLLRDQHVHVVAPEERVAGSRDHLEHVARELEDRHVERATAEVVDGDALAPAAGRAVARAPVAVRERRRGGLVEDAHDLEAGDLAGGLGRRALELVEVGRHRDDGATALLTERLLGDATHLAQHEGADLGERVGLVACLHEHALVRSLDEIEREAAARARDLGRVERTTDQSLDRVDRVLRVEQASLARRVADEHVTLRVERDDRRDEAIAIGVDQHLHARAVRQRDDGVGGAEVDPEYRRRGHRGGRILQKRTALPNRHVAIPLPPRPDGEAAIFASSASIQPFTWPRNGHIQP